MFPPCSMPSFPTIYSLSWRLWVSPLGLLSFWLAAVAASTLKVPSLQGVYLGIVSAKTRRYPAMCRA